jgi:hypothetical protein
MTDQNEIEVTQEMIEAGINAEVDWQEDPSETQLESFYAAIYRAMHKARPGAELLDQFAELAAKSEAFCKAEDARIEKMREFFEGSQWDAAEP